MSDDWTISDSEKDQLFAVIDEAPPAGSDHDASVKLLRAAAMILEFAGAARSVALERKGTLEELAATVLSEVDRLKDAIDRQDLWRAVQRSHDFGFASCELLVWLDSGAEEIAGRRLRRSRQIGQAMSTLKKRQERQKILKLDEELFNRHPSIVSRHKRAENILKEDPTVGRGLETIRKLLPKR